MLDFFLGGAGLVIMLRLSCSKILGFLLSEMVLLGAAGLCGVP